MQLNVEGLTKSKSEIMGKIFQGTDVLAKQETHIPEGKTKRLSIPGFRLIDYIGHNKHGIATYVNQQIDQQLIKSLNGNQYSIGISIGNITIHNVYKPPLSK